MQVKTCLKSLSYSQFTANLQKSANRKWKKVKDGDCGKYNHKILKYKYAGQYAHYRNPLSGVGPQYMGLKFEGNRRNANVSPHPLAILPRPPVGGGASYFK
jgi:hypothetical protein